MTEETKLEERSNFLKEIKAEREALELVRDETRSVLQEARELKAFDALSGKTESGKPQDKPVEESPQEYAERALQGKIEG